MTGYARRKKWAVVHDLRPFVINIHHRCWTRRGAQVRAARSRYYTVMTVEAAERSDREAFAALHDHRWDFQANRVKGQVPDA